MYKYPYLTVEVFLSIFTAIGVHTQRANKKFPKEEKVKNGVKQAESHTKFRIKAPEIDIKIKNTTNGMFLEPVNQLLNFSQRFGVEDAPNGVVSASTAGCRTIMIPDLTEPDYELSKYIEYRADDLMAAAEFIIGDTNNMPE